MKRIIALFISLCMLLTFGSCTEERSEISDYQYMYDGIVNDWNKLAASDSKTDSVLGFGSYRYNSELLLFPRETPSSLEDFYFHWSPGIDVDGYAIYFSCALDENNYSNFVTGLANFAVSTDTGTIEPVYDEEHFSLPTYILQWREVEKKWEVLEYIMLDEENCTAIFVYT